MKIKLVNLMAVLIVVSLAAQPALFAQPGMLRAQAFAQREKRDTGQFGTYTDQELIRALKQAETKFHEQEADAVDSGKRDIPRLFGRAGLEEIAPRLYYYLAAQRPGLLEGCFLDVSDSGRPGVYAKGQEWTRERVIEELRMIYFDKVDSRGRRYPDLESLRHEKIGHSNQTLDRHINQLFGAANFTPRDAWISAWVAAGIDYEYDIEEPAELTKIVRFIRVGAAQYKLEVDGMKDADLVREAREAGILTPLEEQLLAIKVDLDGVSKRVSMQDIVAGRRLSPKKVAEICTKGFAKIRTWVMDKLEQEEVSAPQEMTPNFTDTGVDQFGIAEPDAIDLDLVSKVLDPNTRLLNYQERSVLKLHYGIDGDFTFTYEEIGTILKVARERARQRELKALKKIRAWLSRQERREELLAEQRAKTRTPMPVSIGEAQAQRVLPVVEVWWFGAPIERLGVNAFGGDRKIYSILRRANITTLEALARQSERTLTAMGVAHIQIGQIRNAIKHLGFDLRPSVYDGVPADDRMIVDYAPPTLDSKIKVMCAALPQGFSQEAADKFFQNSGIRTIRDLLDTTETDLMIHRHLSRVDVNAIKGLLAYHGWYLKRGLALDSPVTALCAALPDYMRQKTIGRFQVLWDARTIGDILNNSEVDLIFLCNFSPDEMRLIKELLECYGWHLKPAPIMSSPIESLHNAFPFGHKEVALYLLREKCGVRTIKDLLNRTERDIVALCGFPPDVMRTLKGLLACYGWHMKSVPLLLNVGLPVADVLDDPAFDGINRQLKRKGIATLGELLGRTEDELAAVIGTVAVERVKSKLADRGLSLRPSDHGGSSRHAIEGQI